MKIIILILANDNSYYCKIQDLWRKYMNTHPNIQSYFIKYSETCEKDLVEIGDTIYLRGADSIRPGCFIKTIESLKYILQNKDFDYVLRTNMSSVWNLNKLYDVVSSNNFSSAGVIGIHDGFQFVSGAGILLRKDVAHKLAYTNYPENIFYSKDMPDDVIIGCILKDYDVQMDVLTRFEAWRYNVTPEALENYYHFRCKCYEQWDDTIKIMTAIINLIYGV